MNKEQNSNSTWLKILSSFCILFCVIQNGISSTKGLSNNDAVTMPSFMMSSNDTTICSSDSVLIFLKATIATDSVFIKRVSTGDILSKEIDSAGVYVQAINAGDYELIVSDNLVSTSKVITVSSSTLQAVINEGDTALACYDIDTLAIGASFSFGGTPLYEYTWSSENPNLVIDGNSTDNVIVTQNTEDRFSSSTVFLEIEDAMGCTSIDSIEAVWDVEIDIEFSDRFLFFCEGESATTTAFIKGAGVLENYTWSTIRGFAPFVESADGKTIVVSNAVSGSEIEVRANNSLGCISKDTVNVRQGFLDVEIVIADTVVCTDDIVSLNVAIDSVPNTDYSYLWKVNGVDYSTSKNTTLEITENSNIEIEVIDEALSCPYSESVTVSLSVPIAEITPNSNDTLRICEDVFITSLSSSGSSSGTPFPGSVPYVYTWSTPETNFDLNQPASEEIEVENLGKLNVFVGLVNLSIEDSEGCISTDSVWLEWNNEFRLNILEDTVLFCDGEQTTVSVEDNGLGIFSNYQWNRISGSTLFTNINDTSITVSEATDAVITVIAEDEFGCPSNLDSVFVNDILLDAQLDPLNVLNCVDDVVSLGLSFDSVPGNSYSYEWFVDDVSYSTNDDTTLVITTNQEVKIVVEDDILGCISKDSFDLKISVPIASAGLIDTIDVCNGVFLSQANASLSSAGSPFATGAPYLYSWTSLDPNLGLSQVDSEIVSVENVNELDLLTAKLNLEITDRIGCTSKDSVWFKWEVLKTVMLDKDTLLFCEGTTDTVTAKLIGTGGFSNYIWSLPTGTNGSQNDSVFVFSSANNAVVTVDARDAQGCSYKDSLFVNTESLSATINEPIDKACLDKDIDLSVSNNSYNNGDYHYKWFVDNVAYSNAQDTVYSFSGFVMLRAEVIDSTYGCLSKDSIEVVPNTPVAVIETGLTDTLVNCFTDTSVFISANSSNNGTLPYSFKWTSLDSRVDLSNDTTVSLSVINSGNLENDFSKVFVELTDDIGCISQDSIVINWQKELMINPSFGSLVCNDLNDTISVNPNMDDVAVTWSPDASLSVLGGLINDTLVYNANGNIGTFTINVLIENLNGCSKDSTLSMSLQNLEVELQTISLDVCSSIAVPFIATTQGQSTNLEYNWDGNVSVSNDTLKSYIFSADSLIKVVVQDSNTGCLAKDSLEIKISELEVNANSSSDSICFNENAILSLNSVTGGSGGNNFSWFGGELIAPNTSESVSVQPTALGLASQTEYVLTVTDTLGCNAFDTLFVSRNNQLIPSLKSLDSLCLDSTIVIGNVSGNASGGTGSFNYLWSTNGGSLSSTSSPVTIFNPSGVASNKLVSLVVTDSILTKCSIADDITLKVEGHASLTLDDTTGVCLGDVATLRANQNEVSGLSFEWTNSSITADSLTVNDTISYYVKTVSLLGCVSFDSTRVRYLMPDIISLTGDTSSVCAYDVREFYVEGVEKGMVDWTIPNAQFVVINDTITIRDSIGEGLTNVPVTMNFTNICTDTTVTFDFEFYKVPAPEFSFSLDEIHQQEPFTLVDESNNINNVIYSWEVETTDDSFTSNDVSGPELVISELGFFNAELALKDTVTGCTDTITRSFEVIPAENLVFIPSAFNPNAVNEENRGVKVYGNNLDDEDFVFEIFNRWGVSLYKTTSLLEAQSIGWDGDVENNNITAFTFTLEAKYLDGTPISETGTITLIE